MKRILFALLLAAPLSADVNTLVREGTALHDQGRYDEAIAKYKAALAEDPSSALAGYELAYTYHAKNDTANCISTLEPLVRGKNPYLAQMYAILGNCYDISGDPKRAIDAYRKGLKIDGDETQLLYNLAVTLANTGEQDEARKLLKKELTINPAHRSGHYLLGMVFEAQSFRTAATLSYLRFLSLEPEGPRAKDAATRALTLLGAGIEVKDEKNINITVDPKPRTEEGDFKTVEFMMALAGAAQTTDENENKSEFEKKVGHVSSALKMIVESQKPQRDYTSQQVIPFFRTLYDRKLIDTYAGVAIQTLDLEGGDQWRAANAASIEAYKQLMSAGR